MLRRPRRPDVIGAALLSLLSSLASGCGPTPPATGKAPKPSAPMLTDISEQAGLDFRHRHGGSGRRHMIETIGSGGGFLDIEGDGDLDLYLIQGGDPSAGAAKGGLGNRLYLNEGDGTFVDITEQSGTGDTGYGMGACFGDIDNDGLIDLFVTNFGPDHLYRNNGRSIFTDVTESSGIDDSRWGASCAFADYDQDGDLDLYVVSYVNFTLATHKICGNPELPVYCPPDAYDGETDRLYRNDGGGTFTDVTRESGVYNPDPDEGKGLGVAWTDIDDDGDLDIYVTNDATANFLYRNEGDGTFTDIALFAGAAFNALGVPEASMGLAVGDSDHDGRFDLLVTHLDFETNTLYGNASGELFEDRSDTSGLGAPSHLKVGFGAGFVDIDNDGDLDLLVANGHINDRIDQYKPGQTFAQSDQLFENLGQGRFRDASSRAGPYFATAAVSRAAAFGDIDQDGGIDVLITHNNGSAVLLRNTAERGGWIRLRLRSRFGGRDAIGARVRLVAGDLEQVEEIRSGTGYLSQNDLRLHFGLGTRRAIDHLEIRWPEGEVERIEGAELPIGREHEIFQAQEPRALANPRP